MLQLIRLQCVGVWVPAIHRLAQIYTVNIIYIHIYIYIQGEHKNTP